MNLLTQGLPAAGADVASGRDVQKASTRPVIENTAVILICLLIGALFSISFHKLYKIADHKRQLIFEQEDHYSIGYSLYATDRLYLDGYPSIFRSPGYPVFVALSLHARDALQVGTRALHLPVSTAAFDDKHFVVAMQLLVLLIGGFAFYRIIRRWAGVLPAALLMLVYLVNPLTFTAVRYLNYYTLDYVLVTLIIGACSMLLHKDSVTAASAIGPGICFAVACLVRPVYLISPVLVFGVLWGVKRLALKNSLLWTAVFSAAMLGAILPYSLRNWAVSGRFILISNQGPWVLWGNSVVPYYSLGHLPDWVYDLWQPYGAQIFTQTTGYERYSITGHLQYSNSLSDAFGREFVKQLRSQPQIYTGNVVNNFIQYLIYPQKYFEMRFWDPIPERFKGRLGFLETIFSDFYQILTPLVFALLLIFAYRKVPAAGLGLLLLLYLAASYSFTFLDERYLYARIPALLFSLAMLANTAITTLKTLPPRLSSMGVTALYALSAIAVSSPVFYLFFLRT